MSITFQCPNGHKLNCPDVQAGKPGKCPKCGAVFRVPLPQPQPLPPQPAAEPAAPADSSSNPFAFLSQEGEDLESDRQEMSDQGGETEENQEGPAHDAEPQIAEGPLIAEGPGGADEFVFLCPNGHRLHGPASLVGRPGQCPHCQVRFLIPSSEDVPEDDEVEQDNSVSLDELQIHIDTGAKGSSPAGAVSLAAGYASGSPAAGYASGSKPSVPPPLVNSHPLAALLTRLWAGKTANSSIELHLGDDKLLMPDDFAKQQPFANYGLFAVREANGSHTLTAVAWDSIQRITVRGLPQLPREWFDGRA